MRTILLTTLIAAGMALPAVAQQRYAQSMPGPAEIVVPVIQSVLLENNGGLQLGAGQRVTVAVDAAGALSIVKVDTLGWNAVAPGAGGTSGVVSTAAPGTVVYSLQGPVLKIENGLATAFNYSAVAALDINGQAVSQNVKTCTVMPGRAVFEIWSATVKISSVVVGAPVAYSGIPGCAS